MPSSFSDDRLTRIGIFIDGGFFAEVSDFYAFNHERKARLSISGVQDFSAAQVAQEERIDPKYCRVVDSHYFRGRFSAEESHTHGKLFGDRIFDDVLMRAGVVTHYFPRMPGKEVGIDVWLALEAFELAIYKRFNVLVLVSGDGDYVPLVRKLNTLGTRVMLLAWDFSYSCVDQRDGQPRTHTTRTSQALIDEVTYPVMMHTLIEDRSRRSDPLTNGLFVQQPSVERTARSIVASPHAVNAASPSPLLGQQVKGEIQFKDPVKKFGSITLEDGSELRFFTTSFIEGDFEAAMVGQKLECEVAQDPGYGPKAVRIRLLNPD